MAALTLLLLSLGASLFKSKGRVEVENAALRQQLIVLRRKVRSRFSSRTVILLKHSLGIRPARPDPLD